MTAPHSTKPPAGVDGPRVARPAVVLIAAVARNGVIGREGGMPWRLPGDLAHFRRCTTGRPVMMGRRTYEAIGGALPGRPTIVVSADPAFAPADAIVARSLDAAFAAADRQAAALGADAIMVAGGAVLYGATLARADTLLLTTVDSTPPGDTWFPAIDPLSWIETDRRRAPATPGDTSTYSFSRWDRRAPLPDAGLMAGPG